MQPSSQDEPTLQHPEASCHQHLIKKVLAQIPAIQLYLNHLGFVKVSFFRGILLYLLETSFGVCGCRKRQNWHKKVFTRPQGEEEGAVTFSSLQLLKIPQLGQGGSNCPAEQANHHPQDQHGGQEDR